MAKPKHQRDEPERDESAQSGTDLQPYLSPHSWSLRSIVSRFVADYRKSLLDGSKTLGEIEAIAESRFGRFPDVRDFALRQICKNQTCD